MMEINPEGAHEAQKATDSNPLTLSHPGGVKSGAKQQQEHMPIIFAVEQITLAPLAPELCILLQLFCGMNQSLEDHPS